MSNIEDAQKGRYQLTQPVTMLNPALIEPQAFKGPDGKEKGDPKFSGRFLFDPESAELKEIIGKVAAAAREKWGKSYRYDPKMGALRATKTGADGKATWDQSVPGCGVPFHNGDMLADKRLAKRREKVPSAVEDESGKILRGKIVLQSKSSYRPKLGFVANGGIAQVDDTDESALKVHAAKFYGGAEALAVFNFKATEVQGRFVTAYLQDVLVTGKGKRLATGRSIADTFKSYAGKPSMEDPIGDDAPVDDEIPF